MKAIVLEHAIASSFRSRKDKSLGFSVSTPELTTAQKVALMDLDGLNIRILLEPIDYEIDGKIEVATDSETKTSGQRLRAVMFVLFKYEIETKIIPADTNFTVYYENKMEKIINHCKAKLPEQ